MFQIPGPIVGGYQLDINNLIIQHGVLYTGQTITLPTSYTQHYVITFGIWYSSAQYGYDAYKEKNLSSFTMYNTFGTRDLFLNWITIGY